MSADIVIYAAVAVGLVFWLRNILGTRHGDERQRPNPFTRPPEDANAKSPVHPAQLNEAGLPAAALAVPALNPLALPTTLRASIKDPAAETGVMDIIKNDRGFDLAHFVGGAQDAFVMIVEAFSNGDRDVLRELLSPDLYRAFDDALLARETAGETMQTEIHAVRRTEILEAGMRGRMAVLTLRFVADETAIIKNRDGLIVSGNPDRVSETIDVWTFGRDLKSKDPTWFLLATREEETGAAPIPSA